MLPVFRIFLNSIRVNIINCKCVVICASFGVKGIFGTYCENIIARVFGAAGSVILTKDVAPDKHIIAISSPVSGSVHPQMSLPWGLENKA